MSKQDKLMNEILKDFKSRPLTPVDIGHSIARLSRGISLVQQMKVETEFRKRVNQHNDKVKATHSRPESALGRVIPSEIKVEIPQSTQKTTPSTEPSSSTAPPPESKSDSSSEMTDILSLWINRERLPHSIDRPPCRKTNPTACESTPLKELRITKETPDTKMRIAPVKFKIGSSSSSESLESNFNEIETDSEIEQKQSDEEEAELARKLTADLFVEQPPIEKEEEM